MLKVPSIKLSDGHEIPLVGLGLWKVKEETQFRAAFEAGIAAGYAHFDSAQAYGNEQFLGNAIRETGINRKELFITTKIRTENIAIGRTKQSFARSLEKLQLDYVDLVLLHFPVTIARKKAWLSLEEIKKTGRAKSIGVSNYTIKHLEEMKSYATVMPAVNQVELHIFLQQPRLLDYCAKEGIIVEAYSPLAHGRVMDDPIVAEIAKNYNKSYAQIMLRWCVQKGLVVLPKSVTPSRILENISIFDFELSREDMSKIQNLDRSLRTCWDPTHVP